MLLSTHLFPLLILCVPRSYAHYTLHKRMEVIGTVRAAHDVFEGATGGRGAEEVTKTFSPDARELANGAPHHSIDSIDAVPINGPSSASLRPNQADDILHIDPSSPHTLPTSERVIKAVPSRQTFIPSLKAFFSSFRRIPQIFSRSPRTFSYAPKLADQFDKLHEIEPQHLEPFVDSFVSDLVNKPALWKASIRGDPRLDEIRNIKQQTLRDLTTIREFITKTLPEREEAASVLSQDISENFKIILEHPPYVKSKDPIGKLASELASTNSRSLEASRQGIRARLDSRFAYMADLHGFLGPQNVFSSPITSILKDETLVGHLPEEFQAETFVKQLEDLQNHLTTLDKYHSFAVKPSNGRDPLPQFPPELAEAIDRSDKNLISLVGDAPTLRKLISKLENSEPYRAFQVELTSPKDIAGYELAFVEPLGIARSHDIDERSISYVHGFRVPLHRPVDGIFALNGPARGWAKQNTAERLISASEARDLRENLLKIYTPKGVEYLAKKIRPANPPSV